MADLGKFDNLRFVMKCMLERMMLDLGFLTKIASGDLAARDEVDWTRHAKLIERTIREAKGIMVYLETMEKFYPFMKTLVKTTFGRFNHNDYSRVGATQISISVGLKAGGEEKLGEFAKFSASAGLSMQFAGSMNQQDDRRVRFTGSFSVKCDASMGALAPDVTEEDGGCSVIVRLDHDTLDLVGYHAFCSPYVDTFLDEAGARAMTDCCTAGGMRLNPKDDENLWVFYVPPGDFGDTAVVTNHIVQRLFEATIIWDGAGDIQFPDDWDDPSALGSDCGAVEMPTMVSYDLVEGGTAVDGDTIEAVWDVVGTTALPHAMQTLGDLTRVAILRYPRSVGVFDPTTAEYIVVLEGGI